MTVAQQNDELLARLQTEAEESVAAGDVEIAEATEEEVAAFVGDTSNVAGLQFVSLRDRVGPWNANQGNQAKTLPPCLHHNGPATGVARGADPVARLIGSANYHRSIDWGGGARANGLQYISAVWGNTVYLCRNPLSVLWHAGNNAYNRGSHGCHVPIGTGERANAATLRTLKLWFDEINRTWKLGANRAVSHFEVGQTSCPGALHGDFVARYRAGHDFGVGSSPSPAPTPPPNAPAPGPLYRVHAGGVQRGAFASKQNSLNLASSLLDSHDEVRIAKT
jgi:hypothetical protein